MRGEDQLLAIGRPGDARGRLVEVREFGNLAGVHPADVELWLSRSRGRTFAIGDEGDARAVGRPSWRGVGVGARGEGTVVGAVEINDPEIRGATVGCEVLGISHVHDAFAVGRDLRIRGDLDMEEVHGVEAAREVVGTNGGADDEKAENQGKADFARHRELLGEWKTRNMLQGW